MNVPVDKILIWTIAKYCRACTLKEYQIETRELLTALRLVHHKFEKLILIGSNGSVSLPEDLAGLEELISVQVFDEEHPSDYIDLQAGGRLGPDSLSKIGFSLSYCSPTEDQQSIRTTAIGGVDLSLQGCSSGAEQNASTLLKLPTDAISELHRPEMVRRLLQLLTERWDCTFGGVSLNGYREAVKGDEADSYAGQWLFYLPFPNLAKHLPEDIISEPFSRGTLISTTRHLPDAKDSRDVAAGKRVRDALDDLGLIWNATYAIAGWPPDREERQYEQFISGATADR